MTTATEQLIETFYQALGCRDTLAMARCYHPDVVFSDPVFPELRGIQVMEMWRLLLECSDDVRVVVTGVRGDDLRGQADWEARYTCWQTGRPVSHRAQAWFRFSEGRIIEHKDHYDFWHWSRQAFGARGMLLGWSRALQTQVQNAAVNGLVASMGRSPS